MNSHCNDWTCWSVSVADGHVGAIRMGIAGIDGEELADKSAIQLNKLQSGAENSQVCARCPAWLSVCAHGTCVRAYVWARVCGQAWRAMPALSTPSVRACERAHEPPACEPASMLPCARAALALTLCACGRRRRSSR